MTNRTQNFRPQTVWADERPRGARVCAHWLRSSLAWALWLGFSAATALAAESDGPFAAPESVERVATPGAGSLLQVTLSLFVVLAAVFAAAWLLRKLNAFGRFGTGPIEIVGDIAVGTKERAVLVQVGAKQLLIGVAPGRVNLLHVLDEPVAVNRGGPTTPVDSSAVQRADFKSILKRSLGL